MRRMFSEEQIKKLAKATFENQDIQVNGITSKGIANTGAFANIGDVAVSGNIEATGYIKAGAYEFDEDITLSNLPENMTPYYSHARISNGKLNIVVAFFLQNAKAITGTPSAVEIGSLEISESVYNKLYPYSVGGDILTNSVKRFASIVVGEADGTSGIRLRKYSSGGKYYLVIQLFQQSVTANESYGRDVRFEFNFMLS